MAQLAIRGHATRGREVIELLEMLGGINKYNLRGSEDEWFVLNGTLIQRSDRLFAEKGFPLEEFFEKFPYKVRDEVIAYAEGCLAHFTIQDIRWNNELNKIEYKICSSWCDVSLIQPYKEETMEDKNNLLQQLKEYFENTPREVIEKEWHEYDKYNEIGPDVIEYLEYVNNIRNPKYPKTYEGCCDVLKIPNDERYIDIDVPLDYNKLLYAFTKLLICRNAYWKIAGDKMGLEKPWKPDWINTNSNKYCIYYVGDEIKKQPMLEVHHFLAFPTAEMRDAFYENFKDLIESCKELL